MPNFLTIDLEEYYHVNYPGFDASALINRNTNLEAIADRLLLMCSDAEIYCTFFALGQVAEKYPNIIRKIHLAGHEVASHGHAHQEVRSMTPQQFHEDIERSCGVLEALTGDKVLGFRAPCFSVTADVLPWFYEILERRGLTYSSSVFPGRTFLYGIDAFPEQPHCPVVCGSKTGIIEFPITAFEVLRKRFPLYVRLLSAGMIERKLRATNRAGSPGMIYIHPREIDPTQPRLPLSRGLSLIHYWGIRGCEAKLRRLMDQTLDFRTIREYVTACSEELTPANGVFDRG